jgi:DNA repair exonuclease SbcCD ATPase subunit
MRITYVTLRNYRLHRELKVDFDPSRTLIGGPNETGKSTLIEAVHRALFLKAKGNTEQHRAMVSSLHSGHPEVELAFEAGGNSYLLKKRFSSIGTTTLAPSNSVSLSGDAAESELARILSVEAGVTGKAITLQWAHLWVWQGQAGDDPSAHATAQQNGLLQRLQQMGGAAALQSELDARVAKHFAEIRDQIYTQAGKPKTGSELERAESAHALAQEELALANDRVRKLDSAAVDLENASRALLASSASLIVLEKQHEATEAKMLQLVDLRQQEAEQSHAAKGAVARHGALDSANRQILKARVDISELEESLKPQNKTIAGLESASQGAKGKAATAEMAYRTAAEAVRAARIRHDLASAHTLLFDKVENYTKLSVKGRKVSKLRRDLSELEEQLAKLPKVDKAKLNKLQKLESDCSNARSALQAMATGIEVVASDKPVKAGGQSIKAGQQQILTEDTEVQIGSAIRLRIQPGGGTSLAEARQAEGEARKNLQVVLDSVGLPSVKEATEVHASRDDFGSRIKTANAELEGMGAESLAEELQSAQNDLTAAKANVERLTALAPDIHGPKDKAAVKALAKGLEGKLCDAEDRETEAKTTRDRSAKTLVSAEEALNEKRTETEQQKLKLNGMNAQLDLLLKTHGDDTARDHALIECQSVQSAAENLLKKTTDAIIPLQPELLESDRTRIARAIKERTSEQSDARTQIAVAKAALRSDGSEDPATDLALAEAKARSASKHRSVVQRHLQAVALLGQLFQDEQRSLAEQFTKPLADKISAYLQCIFGAGAQAQVDREDNQFSSLRLYRPGFGNAPFDFDTLSGGTKEQTAAAVRLAMAEVLATDYDGCLPVVFDDAFAYSDPERVNQLQRMLDLAATRGLQVIVLTCNPADYAALGAKTVVLRPE